MLLVVSSAKAADGRGTLLIELFLFCNLAPNAVL